ncbi:hypothetical protein FH608_019675 [Nonomuraea phyllanthi]|uniref:SGNH hydrolase-type esterase domain-containing protein n=1 Tax=Nonomuraea phyllanthi TaxID=2219224 RepID=A0A5C4WH82_9ACTN|nr:SGNH/GDSL hydrolase family protein [Nonomuraea phyllanthi]KAB8193462.1 hypothetical protein FH608_019675 [Nonomuraea phyllanthi]
MKRRIVIGLCLLLTAALGLTGAVGYLTFLRPAGNPPADARTDGPGQRPRVVAAGASMTQGSPGADRVATLRARPEFHGREFVNAGVNGSTTADLRQRVDSDIVACGPAAVTLLIGTNDVRNGVPLPRFRADLRAIVDHVRARTTARIALMSLPPLGEDLNTEINHRLTAYNAAIQETAAQHYLLGRSWDEIARAGGRDLLVDHIHLSDRGGAIVADLVGRWLADRHQTDPGARSPRLGEPTPTPCPFSTTWSRRRDT